MSVLNVLFFGSRFFWNKIEKLSGVLEAYLVVTKLKYDRSLLRLSCHKIEKLSVVDGVTLDRCSLVLVQDQVFGEVAL